MGVWSNAITALIGGNLITGRKNTAANVRAVFGGVVEAVAFLEGLSRGAKILHGYTPPDAATGIDGDAYLNLANGDLYLKEAGDWGLRVVLKGEPGRNGTNGTNGRTPVLGVDYTVTNGTNGKSAYQLWVDAGNTGTQAQFLASLEGRDGTDGNRITASAASPVGGTQVVATDGADEPGFISIDLTFANRKAGDLHFQTLTADRYRLWYYENSSWITLYTTPAGATIADGTVTNAKLTDDVKVGSLAGARNAFPAADRAGLTTVEAFLVWIGPKITDLFTRVGGLDTAFSGLSSLVNGFAGRISALEARPVGGTSSGGTGTASYPAQSASTANKFLMSSGAAGGESWATVANNRVGWILAFKNEISRNQRFFRATGITRIEKDAGISTLSYSINGATAVQVVFTGNAFTPTANSPLSFPAGSLITWSITYTANASEAAFEVEGTETV